MFTGACTSQIGTQMQTAAQSWLVLDLSHDNARYLGIDGFLGQIPIVLFSLLGGVLADRRDRRTFLLTSQYTQMTCALVLATLAITGVVQVWHVWVLSFIVGTAQAFGGPSYSALVPSLVPKEHLPNAIALNSMQFNLARVIGPTFGGVALATLGAAWCFYLNAASFLAVILTLYMIRVSYVPPRSREPILTSMKQGIGFIQAQPGMKGLMVLAFLVTFFGFQTIFFLPVVAREVFHAGPQTFTLMLSFSGAGAVTGALIVAAIGKTKHMGKKALIGLTMLGVITVGFAQSTTLPLSCVVIFMAGMAVMGVFSMIMSLVQLITSDDMRGRVMSVFNLCLRGGGPVGMLVSGWLIPIYTVSVVLTGAGLGMVLLGLYFLLIQRRVAEL
jgi:MFS family permease